MNIDPNAPAYPFQTDPFSVNTPGHALHLGIPIRLEIASRVMAGLVAGKWNAPSPDCYINPKEMGAALYALKMADALIEAHNQSVKCPPH